MRSETFTALAALSGAGAQDEHLAAPQLAFLQAQDGTDLSCSADHLTLTNA